MKKIRVWKVALLSIVTLGVYLFFWFIERRKELLKESDVKIPHVVWLFAPAIAAVLVLLASTLTLGIYASSTNHQPSANSFLAVFWLFMILVIASAAINCWWVWKFSRAVEYVTKGRMTANWSLAYWVLLGGVMVFVQQYYLNRAPFKAAQKPSQQFVIWSSVVLGLALLNSIVSTVSIPSDINKLQQDVKNAQVE